MKPVNARTVGYVFAVFLGTWHAFWALLVWAGAAQWLLDFVFRLHMIAPAYHVTVFSPLTAASLVAVTALIGFFFGWFAGWVWNYFAGQHGAGWRFEEARARHAH
jgi:hypothetical protein